MMQYTGLTKVFDTPTLKRLCDRALELKFATGPNERFWEQVDPDGKHVCGTSFYHSPNLAMWEGRNHGFDFAHNNGVNIRAEVLCKMRDRDEPQMLLCDFDQADFESLPDAPKLRPK